jgi:hypothetical protein
MPSFSSDDIKNITRRQINIVTENQGFDLTIAGMNANAAKLLGVDNANKAFWDDYHSKCTSYEVEYRQINGLYAPTYTETDIQESAKRNSLTPPNIFFPFTPSIAYKQFAPLVDYDGWAVNQTRGIFFSTGPDARYELNILTNPVETLSLFKMIERLQNGIGGSGTTATTGTITAGSMAEQTLVSAVLPAISAGMPAYLYDGTASGLYNVNSITLVTGTFPAPDTYYVKVQALVPVSTSASDPTLAQGVSAFTTKELEELNSANYDEYLENLAGHIDALVAEWQAKLSDQQTQSGGNTDSRSPFNAQNSTAAANTGSALSTIAAFQALPRTGSGNRFTSLGPISSLISTRLSQAPAREGQILAALGGSAATALTQPTGETFAATDVTNPYYKRHMWLDKRINVMYGSYSRYLSSNSGAGHVQSLKDANVAIKAEYDSYFNTKKVIANDGTNIIQVANLTGLNIGDTINILSDSQPIISRTILALLGTTSIKLSSAVPADYKTDDLARIYKVL